MNAGSSSPPFRSRLDPEPLTRRDFLGLAALWMALTALLCATLGMLRLPKAAVISSPSKKFRVTLPETLQEGQALVPAGRPVAIFRDAQGVYAISLVCTHLGCIVKPFAGGFECPCHGTLFSADGSVTRGPALEPLAWYSVTGRAGTYVVNEDSSVPPGTKAKA